MPRNSSGVYSLPVAAFVAGTTIKSADMNTDLSDIGTALTQSLATNGVSSMTAPLKLAAGTAAAPSLTLASDATTGWYNDSAGSWTFVSTTVPVVGFSLGAMVLVGTMDVSGAVVFHSSMTVLGTVTLTAVAAVDAATPLSVRNSSTGLLEYTLVSYQLGTGAGVKGSVRGLGTGNNDLTQVRYYLDTTEIFKYTSTTVTFDIATTHTLSVTVGSSIVINSAGYIDVTEIAAPAAPGANVMRLYSKDVSTVTQLFAQDAAGLETNLMQVPSTGYNEYLTNTDLTTALPIDDTIPQSTEGTQILSVAVTPKRSTSRIRVMVNTSGSVNGQLWGAALFNGAAGAVKAQSAFSSTGNICQDCNFVYEYAPGSAAAVTWTVRVGPAAGTLRMNGPTTGRFFGGVAACTLSVQELFQ